MSSGISDNKATNKKRVRTKVNAATKAVPIALPAPVPADVPQEVPKAALWPAGVIDEYSELDRQVSSGLRAGVEKLLVTSGLLKEILRGNYKNDRMMMYRNMPIYDYEHVSETERQNAQSINQKLFADSKVSIGQNSILNVTGAKING